MAAVMRRVLDSGARAVALVGSDLPALPASAIVGAFAALHDAPDVVVIGPAADGGYYLIAASCHVPNLFHDIAWGTGRVLDETRRRAAQLDIRLHLVESSFDVDTVDDLVRLATLAADPDAALAGRRTRGWAQARGIAVGKRPIL